MRKKRPELKNGFFHVMNRGANHQDIFRVHEDRMYYLDVLKKTMEDLPYTLHAYCLMSNHYHLLIQTGEIDLNKIMQKINLCYTKYFNYKYDRDGPLFRGRYHLEQICTDFQFMMTSRYIHRNPIEAKIVKTPEQYRWSSFRAYMGLESNDLVSTAHTFQWFENQAEQQYRDFVMSKENPKDPEESSL